MDFTACFSPNAPISAGQSATPISGEDEKLPSKGKGGKMTFKGVAGTQVVEYVALLNANRTRMSGGYLSHAPDDYGFFVIRNY